MTIRTRDPRATASLHQSKNHYLQSLEGDHRICNVDTNPSQPWLTLIIGSGCTTSETQVDALLAMAGRLADTIAAPSFSVRLGDQPILLDGDPLPDVVRRFAEDLIADRLRIPRRSSPNASGSDVIADGDEWVAEVFVAAALLTKLYFQTKALSNDAPRRPDHGDDAELSPDSTSWWRLKEELIGPCRKVLKNLQGQAGRIANRLDPDDVGQVRDTVLALIDGLSKLVDPGEEETIRIGLSDLQSLAEFAWLSLTATARFNGGPSVYPGWSDLLLDLSNYDAVDEGRVGMPMFRTMSAAQDIIRTRYIGVTEASWKSGPTELYRTAAKLLVAEERLRTHLGRKSTDGGCPTAAKAIIHPRWGITPLPVAFVTSFDLELELALLREDSAFSVALPVHVLNTQDNVAHTSWLAIRVPPPTPGETRQRLPERLTKPEASQLRILGGNTDMDGPLVVRISGCPLIELPDLTGADTLLEELAKHFAKELQTEATWVEGSGKTSVYEARLDLINTTLALQSAVIISEHDAILQNELDLLTADDWSSDSVSENRLGLYPEVTRETPLWARLWMLLGVQIRDSAVRQRIATLVSATMPSNPSMRTTRCGVAVDPHPTELEQDLLFWNGLSVVKCDAAEFAADVAHYTEHIDVDHIVPFEKGACRV